MRKLLMFCIFCIFVFPLFSVILHFEVGTTELTELSQQDLGRFVDEFETYFQQNPQTLIFITGHTDDTGTEELNKKLSLSRAGLIRDYLVNEMQIDSAYIKIFGKSSKEPVASNDDERGRYLNRRVEIVFEKPEAKVKWLQNIVEYISSKSGEILKAEPDIDLFRYDKVNTEDRSRSGIEFSDSNLLILEENSLMIIYGDISSSFANLLDDKFHVELKYGKLYNKLENMRNNPINVKTLAADLELFSSLNNIEFNDNRTLTSIYEGYGLVMAQGSSVKVVEGYGVQVKVGDEPGEPVKLPDTPVELIISVTQPTLSGELVAMQWTGSAAEYLIQIAPTEEFQILLEEITVLESSTQLNLDYGEYLVRIQARDEIGLTSPFSAPLSVLILEQEYLICNELKEGKINKLVDPILQFSGTVTDYVDVLFEDKPLTISNAGTFSGKLPLQYGSNTLLLKAVLPDKTEKLYTYKILFQPELDKTIRFMNLQKEVQNIVYQEDFTIKAETSELTRLFINNQEFTSAAPGSFQFDMKLVPGMNTLDIMAEFIDGSQADHKFEVVYDKVSKRMTTLEILAAISVVLITSVPLLINMAK